MNSMGKINPPLRPFHNFLRKKLTLMYMQMYFKKKTTVILGLPHY